MPYDIREEIIMPLVAQVEKLRDVAKKDQSYIEIHNKLCDILDALNDPLKDAGKGPVDRTWTRLPLAHFPPSELSHSGINAKTFV